MQASLKSRIAALEALRVEAKPHRRPATPEEAQAAYDWLMAPGPSRPEPDDGFTPAERYMRMLNGPIAGGRHGNA